MKFVDVSGDLFRASVLIAQLELQNEQLRNVSGHLAELTTNLQCSCTPEAESSATCKVCEADKKWSNTVAALKDTTDEVLWLQEKIAEMEADRQLEHKRKAEEVDLSAGECGGMLAINIETDIIDDLEYIANKLEHKEDKEVINDAIREIVKLREENTATKMVRPPSSQQRYLPKRRIKAKGSVSELVADQRRNEQTEQTDKK